MKSLRLLAAAVSLFLPFLLPAPFAFAHDDAYLATLKAPNRGQLRMAGPYHYELVAGGASGGTIVVYVTDHAGTPVPTKGARGVVQGEGEERRSVELVPGGANRMEAVGAPAWTNDATVVVSITIAGAHQAQARFELGAAATFGSARSRDAAAGHGH
jgi:hypothetical protein